MSETQVSGPQLAHLAALAESVDRLVGIDISGRGVVDGLYAAARAAQGGEPLGLLAARKLLERVGIGDVVLISTCMPVGTYPNAEQDGPVGAATLARSLVIGPAARPVVVVEQRNRELMEATLRAAGLYALPLDEALTQPTACGVVEFTLDEERAHDEAQELLAHLRPAALIAIERAGANEFGEHHGARGNNVTAHNSKQDVLYQLAREAGALTIGIGDGGNEFGCALIRDHVVEHVPHAARCACPCGGTIVPAFEPDVLVIAAVSNWGAYAIEAMLTAALGRAEILHDRDVDLRVHSFAAMAGANNDGPRLLDPGSDAIDASYHGRLLDLLGLLVRNGADPGNVYHRRSWPWLALEGGEVR